MAKQSISIGSSANDGTGTPLRDAFDICNDNFTEIYAVNGGSAAFPSLGSAGQILQVNSGGTALEFAAGSSVSDLNGLSDVSVDLTNDSAYFINIPAGLSGASGNLVIGESAANSMVGSDQNIILGFEAFKDNVNGVGANVIIGYQAAYLQTSGQATNAVAIGYRAAGGMGNPYNSVSIGYEAGRSCTNGYEVVFVGREAGKNSNTNYQVFVGTRAGQSSTAQYGVAIGHQAGQSMTGSNSIAIGREANKSNTATGTVSIGSQAGYSNTSGSENTNIGYQAAYSNTTSGSNTNVGYQAAYYATGQQLAAFGYRALFGSSGASSGSYNSAFGREAGVAVTSGSQNTLLGAAAGKAITTGANNTVIGSFAAFNSLIDGDNNIVIGKEAAPSATGVDNEITLGNASITALRIPGLQSSASDGDVLTFSSGTGLITLQAAGGGGVTGKVEGTNFTGSIIVGHSTTGTLSSAENNTALGIGALDAITQGDDNVAVGKDAGTALTTGTLNTLLGKDAGLAITTIHGTTALGHSAAKTQNNNSYGTYVGYEAGRDCTGSQQTMIGGSTRAYSAGGDSNGMVAVGYGAQDVQGGVYCTSVGYAAGNQNQGANTVSIGRDTNRVNTQSGTLSVGYQAGYSQTSGQANTNVGYQAGYSNTTNGYRTMLGNEAGEFNTGANNTFIGYHAGTGVSGSSTADRSTIIGSEAGEALTSAVLNVFIGYQAGKAMTVGHSNVAVGSEALKTEDSRSFSVAVGTSALTSQNAGAHAYNTGLGHNAGNYISTGVQNTCVGAKAGADNSLITGSNNIVIGYNAQPSADNVDNEITLGDANITAFRCADQSIAALSDARDKTNVKDSSFGLDFIDSIRPVEFEWDFRPENMAEAKQGKKRVGFIAQELQEAMPNGENEILDLVYEINEDRIEAKYGNLIPILVKAVQELKAEIELLKQ